ncbi:hypothetical protein BGZ81_007915 [Podila clonocystis]|nr:hypothetical protein BGZ81_007915 [Podila clonocystis]
MKAVSVATCLLFAAIFAASPADAILRKCGKDLPCPEKGQTCCLYQRSEPSEYGSCLPSGCPEGWTPLEPIPTA